MLAVAQPDLWSADLLAELEQDNVVGQARAEDLQKQIERDRALADLTRDETDAVRRTIGEVIGARDRRSFWQQAAMNFVFFALGVVATALVG